MHDTAFIAGTLFAKLYGRKGGVVLDVGGKNVNGSLRASFEEQGMKYICLDMEQHPSVDVVCKPTERFPFENGSIDFIVSTSCFEHDPCFWMTFKEMTRILKPDGFIYMNAPSNGVYHGHPGDNWRFYSDAGQALSYWSGIQVGNEEVFPVTLVETFHFLKINDIWTDFIAIWKRTDTKETHIKVSTEVLNNVGLLESQIHLHNLKTVKNFSGFS